MKWAVEEEDLNTVYRNSAQGDEKARDGDVAGGPGVALKGE